MSIEHPCPAAAAPFGRYAFATHLSHVLIAHEVTETPRNGNGQTIVSSQKLIAAQLRPVAKLKRRPGRASNVPRLGKTLRVALDFKVPSR